MWSENEGTMLTCQPTTRSHAHRFTEIKFRTSSRVLVLNVGLLPTLQKFRSALTQCASRSSPRGFISKDPHIVWCAFDLIIFLNYLGKRQKPRGKFANIFFVFLFWRSPEKNCWRSFFLRTLAPVSLVLEHSCSWPSEGLSSKGLSLALASEFFLCPWSWPRALCSRLHLCS